MLVSLTVPVRAHDFSISITYTDFIWPNDFASSHPV